MSLEKLAWGEEIVKEFDIKINGKDRKFVLRSLSTDDSLEMDLHVVQSEKPDMKAILADSIEMLSRSIVSIDGNFPDSAAETKEFLKKKTQPGDVFNILDKFQTLGQEVQEEVKN